MRLILITAIAFFLAGCKSSHKFTGTDYIDLSVTQAGALNTAFPQEIADSLGWGDLTSTGLKIKEEIRISITSEFAPNHIFRFFTKRKVTGESILFWPKKGMYSLINMHENMEQYLEGRCSGFFETENFGYCKPEYWTEPDWENVYKMLETQKVWTVPGSEAIRDSALWQMNTQVRLKNYFRNYTYFGGNSNSAEEGALNLIAITSQLQTISSRYKRADNFNIYSGIVNGTKSSEFSLCNEKETWRFEGNLKELISESGYSASFEDSKGIYFYVTVSGTVEDEWYGNRGTNGYIKVIRPSEINELVILTEGTCPTGALR